MLCRVSSLGCFLIVGSLLLFAASAGAQEVSPRCQAAMDTAAGNYSRCLLRADAGYAVDQNQSKQEKRQARCERQFDRRTDRAIRRNTRRNEAGECASSDLVTIMKDRTESYARGIATEASGTPSPSLLFVQNTDGGTLTETTLTLTGVSSETGWFTDRPYREAGHIPNEGFLRHWYGGENSFAHDPPNAAFTCTVDREIVNHVVELTMPLFTGDELTYTVQGIGDRDLPTDATCDGSARLFIDVIEDYGGGMECWKKVMKKYPARQVDMTDEQHLNWDREYFMCFPCPKEQKLVELPAAFICSDRVTNCHVDSDCPTDQTCHRWARAGFMCLCPDGGIPGFNGRPADCSDPPQ